MSTQHSPEENKVYQQFRTTVDFAMGVLYILLPMYMMRIQYILEEYGRSLVYSLSILCMLYGLTRMIRAVFSLRKWLRKPRDPR
jgi:hypothetical protein